MSVCECMYRCVRVCVGVCVRHSNSLLGLLSALSEMHSYHNYLNYPTYITCATVTVLCGGGSLHIHTSFYIYMCTEICIHIHTYMYIYNYYYLRYFIIYFRTRNVLRKIPSSALKTVTRKEVQIIDPMK